MKPTIKYAVAAIILVLRFATPVVAGPLEDAFAFSLETRDGPVNLSFTTM